MPFNMTSLAFWVSRQYIQQLGLILFILCLFYVGESQSISEAKRGVQTQQCPIGKVAGNPCRGRFNIERMVGGGMGGGCHP